MSEAILNVYGNDRIGSRQIDELIGMARGIAADGQINQAEAEYLQSWLAANLAISDQPLIATLYSRISDFLIDGELDADEAAELLDTLNSFTGDKVELGEALKATNLPLCNPAPQLQFEGHRYCFTGTFVYGQRKACEAAVAQRGAVAGSLTSKTDYLVIGSYATEAWKHSTFGLKILKAADSRAKGQLISIVSEDHWAKHLA